MNLFRPLLIKLPVLLVFILPLLLILPTSQVASVETEDVLRIARLYSAAFDRQPRVDGLNFWVDKYEDGSPLTEIAKQFVSSPEFVEKYGPLSDKQYVEQLFLNVLGRPGRDAGIEFWTDNLSKGTSREKVLMEFADSTENVEKTSSTLAYMRLCGREWSFANGTQMTTEMVKDLAPGDKSSLPWNLIDYKNYLYFTAEDGLAALLRSDGTNEGTGLFKTFAPDQWGADPGAFAIASGKFFFRGTDYTHGTELWASIGTPEDTKMTRDIWSGVSRGLLSSPMPFKNGVLIIADDGESGPQFWTSDGTEAGTSRFEDKAISTDAKARNFWRFGDSWLFNSTDAVHGAELWSTNGMEGASKLVKDTIPGPTGGFSSGPFSFAQLNSVGVFWVWKENADELWITDGTEIGTQMFWTLPSGLTPDYKLIRYQNMVLFFAEDSNGDWSLWRTDGTDTGTKILKKGFLDLAKSYMEYDGFLYLTLMTRDRVSGNEIWRTDGTEAGTQLFVDLNPGPSSSSPSDFTCYAGQLYFVATDGVLGEELYRTDGTPYGTELVSDINLGSADSTPNQLTVSHGALFFDAYEPVSGRELYKTTMHP